MIERILAVIRQRVRPGARVGILGLSYKPNTPVIEESPGLALTTRLLEERYPVTAYDPQALAAAQALLGDRFTPAPDAEACAASCDALVITTPWPEFRSLSPAAVRRHGTRTLIVDCWRILPRERFAGISDVVQLGRSALSTECKG